MILLIKEFIKLKEKSVVLLSQINFEKKDWNEFIKKNVTTQLSA